LRKIQAISFANKKGHDIKVFLKKKSIMFQIGHKFDDDKIGAFGVSFENLRRELTPGTC
jgi:hypothetical protein